MYWPRGGIKAIVHPNQTKTIIILPKIVPETEDNNEEPFRMETNKFKTSFFWKEKPRAESNN